MASEQWSNGDVLSQHPQQPQQQPMQQQLHHHHQIPQQPQQQQLQPQSHHSELDRQLIRHLLAKYSNDDIARLVQEERQHSHGAQSDAASVLTSSTFSSVKSEDATSLFDSASIRSLSDTSSRSSILSNVSARTAKFLSRKSQSGPSGQATSSRLDDTWDADENVVGGDSGSGASGAPKQKGAFMCGFCKEEGIQKTCTRKNDLKRHIEDFHNTNSQWICRNNRCGMVFDWQGAYKTHLKLSHGGSRMNLDDAKVEMCPQTVFACGFENCPQVFEAHNDTDASATFKEYVGHVVKHFDEGSNSGEWTYSTRMRNLLRQSGVLRAWTNSSWPEADRSRLQWEPQSSIILRKRLETRHVGDLQVLVQIAIALGSDPNSVTKLPPDFNAPVLNTCQMMIQGHHLRAPPAPQMAPQMEQHVPQDADQFNFKIQRQPNPNLAAYLASQRRVYVPRPAVRAGRSARPPTHTLSGNSHGQAPAAPMTPQYNNFHGATPSPMYDPQHHHMQNQQAQHHQPHHQQQNQHHQFNMMPQVNGGIVEADLRSLRSMASSAGESDIEMSDSQMMDTGYMPQQQHDFSAYGTGAMQSAPTDLSGPPAMEQHHAYAAYDAAASHAF